MPILPDLLSPDLHVVFCGTAAGHASAARGFYPCFDTLSTGCFDTLSTGNAGPGNQFWPVLHRLGLTP